MKPFLIVFGLLVLAGCGGAGQGTPAVICQPGAVHNCLCPDRSVGRKVCAPSGQAFLGCQCGGQAPAASLGNGGAGRATWLTR